MSTIENEMVIPVFSVKTMRAIVPQLVACFPLEQEDPNEIVEPAGFDCGLFELNEILDGIRPGYIVIGSRPGIGKSSLALTIGKNMAKNGHKGVMFSLEMDSDAIALRALASEAGIPGRILRTNSTTTAKEKARIQQALKTLEDIPLAVVDTLNTANDIADCLRHLVNNEGYSWAIIDYLTLIKSQNENLSRHEQISEISRTLCDLRRELKIPIIVLMQIRRDAEGKPPCLTDIRESGCIEQDADTIIFLHRERIDGPLESQRVELHVVKQRDGPIGTVDTLFFPHTGIFCDDRTDRC